MANMNISDRNQSERATLAGSGERIRRGSERGTMVYTLVAIPIALLLCYAAIKAINGWAQWVVLGGILLTSYAFMRAVGPNRMGAGEKSTPPVG